MLTHLYRHRSFFFLKSSPHAEDDHYIYFSFYNKVHKYLQFHDANYIFYTMFFNQFILHLITDDIIPTRLQFLNRFVVAVLNEKKETMNTSGYSLQYIVLKEILTRVESDNQMLKLKATTINVVGHE